MLLNRQRSGKSEDPQFPTSGSNPFAYVDNDPTNWVDPSGLEPYDPESARRRHAELVRKSIDNELDKILSRQLVQLKKQTEDMIGILETNKLPVDPLDREYVAKIDEILKSREQKGQPPALLERERELQGKTIPNLLGEISDLERQRKEERQPHFQRRLEENIHTANRELTRVRRQLGLGEQKVNPLKWSTLPERFELAAQMAIESGNLADDVKETLIRLAGPAAAVTVGTMSIYAGLHGTAAAPALLVLDALFIGLGGREAILSTQRIYSALEAATDEEGLREASKVLERELSGALAVSILAILAWGAQRGGNKFGENFELNPDVIPGGTRLNIGPGGPFRRKNKRTEPIDPVTPNEVTTPNAAAKAKSQGEFVDPQTNKVVKTTETLAADHIFPKARIKELPGFKDLTPEQQSAVLNNLENFRGLPQSLNASKGSKIDWSKYKGEPLDGRYAKELAKLQQIMKRELQSQINMLLEGNK